MVLQRNRRRQRKKKTSAGIGAPVAPASSAPAPPGGGATDESGASSGCEDGGRVWESGTVTCPSSSARVQDEDTSFFSPASGAGLHFRHHDPGSSLGSCSGSGASNDIQGGQPEVQGAGPFPRRSLPRQDAQSLQEFEKRSFSSGDDEDVSAHRQREEGGAGEWSATESDEPYSKVVYDEEDDDDYESRHPSDGDSSFSSREEEDDDERYEEEEEGSNPPLEVSGDDEEDDEEDDDDDSQDLRGVSQAGSAGVNPQSPRFASGDTSRDTVGDTSKGAGEGGGAVAKSDIGRDEEGGGNMESDMYFTESDDEDAKEYRKGGYHPVKVGEIYNHRYRIEAKLGWGHFSTVWLATDLHAKPLDYVAIKFQKSAKHYTEAAVDEVHLLTAVKEGVHKALWREASKGYSEIVKERLAEAKPADRDSGRIPPPPMSPNSSVALPPVVVFKEKFSHVGPNGRHMCLVFEVLGPNLLSLIKRYNFRGLPMNLVRRVATDVLYGLSYLHDVCNIIHTDLKPENVCVSAYPLPPPRAPSTGVTAGEGDVPGNPALTAEDRKRERRRRKKQNRKRKKALAAAAASGTAAGEEEKSAAAGGDKDLDEDEDEDHQALCSNTGGENSQEPRDKGDNTKEEGVDGDKDEEEADVKNNTPPYVKAKLRPSRSDPSLLTTYTDNIHALQGTLNRHMYNFVGYSQFRNPAAYCCPRTGRRIMYWLPVDYDCPGGEAASQVGDTSPARDASAEGSQDKKGDGSKKGKGSGGKTGSKGGNNKGGASGSAVSPRPEEKGENKKDGLPGRAGNDGDTVVGHKKKKREPELQQLPLLHDDLLLHPVAEGVFAKQQKAAGGASQDGEAGGTGGTGKGTGTLMWGPYAKLAPGEEPVKECTVVDTSEGKICIKPLPPGSSYIFEQPSAVYKLCDLGNACWVQEHFTDDIQTRQYRSPEVIIRAGYDCSADVWSFACMLFELITGDYLFDPKSSSDFDRDEDHLALIIELLGMFPSEFISRGRLSSRFFRSNTGQLRNIQQLRFWPLDAVLREKYHLPTIEAESLSDFLLPMLVIDPRHRQSAAQMLRHPWLRMRTLQDEIVYAQMRRNMHVSHPVIDGVLQQLPPTGDDADEDDAGRACCSALASSPAQAPPVGGVSTAAVALTQPHHHLAAHPYNPHSLFHGGAPASGTSHPTSSGSSFSGVAAASSCAPLLLSSGAGAALVTSLPPPPPPPVSASNPAASRAGYSGGSTLDSVLLSPSNRGPLSGSSVALNSAVSVAVAAASGQVPPPPPPPPPPPIPSHISSVPLVPHQPSPLGCCSLPSHPPYPLRTENQTGTQQQLPRSSDANVGVEAAGGRGPGSSNAGPVSFLTGSSLAAFQHHLRTAQLSSVVAQGQAAGAGGQSSNATLFGQQLPPHDLQQLLLLLPPEKQQLLLQETGGGPGVSAGRGGVEAPASAAGAPSMETYDQAFVAGRLDPTTASSSPPNASFSVGRNGGLGALTARATYGDHSHVTAGERAAKSGVVPAVESRRQHDCSADKGGGSLGSRSSSLERHDQIRQGMLLGAPSNMCPDTRLYSSNDNAFAGMQQHCTSLPIGIGTGGGGASRGALSVCGPPDVDFSPHQPFSVTAGVGGTDSEAAADLLLATDCQGQLKGSRGSLPSGVASGSFPWRVQGQQLTSAELLAAFKQDQRALSSCFSYDGVSGQGAGPQSRSGTASDVNHHLPYSACSAQQGAGKVASNLETFVSHQGQQVAGSRGGGFSGVGRKDEERGWPPAAVMPAQTWRPDCPGIEFHAFASQRQQHLDHLAQHGGVQRTHMQQQFHELETREKVKQQLLREQEDLTRLLGKAQQQYKQHH
ncbi:cmcg kinase (incomplete catalytic triad) [Cystoisospora suis]|uniref:non-specific serine/threonine protein kinase n=1 Tax=Cystoisospora suis TaxID=483139 RepID=A0A2C6LDA3_9APIC|nr:cmcg kinase (incomplete catalytic triad) [Cystoisospora suis]